MMLGDICSTFSSAIILVLKTWICFDVTAIWGDDLSTCGCLCAVLSTQRERRKPHPSEFSLWNTQNECVHHPDIDQPPQFTSNRKCACLLSRFSCVWLCDTMDCSLPGSSVQGILQVRILEWVAGLSSRGSSLPKDWTWISCVFCIARPLGKPWVGSHIDPNLVLQLPLPSGQPTLLHNNTSCSPPTAQTCMSKPQTSSKMTCL